MNALIINLTRFGDILQTQAIVHGLRQKGYRISMLCLDNFVSAASLLHGVENSFSINGSKFLANIHNNTWQNALIEIEKTVKEVTKGFGIDLILNLTSNQSAKLLTYRLAQEYEIKPEIRGFCMDEYGFDATNSAWACYFESSTLSRACSPYNIVDSLLKSAGLELPAYFELEKASISELEYAKDSLLEKAKTFNTSQAKFVGFQLGASDIKRQWKIESFAKLGEELFKNGYIPVLLGTKQEEELGNKYLELSSKAINLIAKSDLTQLRAYLSNLELLITNDTGTMHLAAGLGLKSIAIFLKTAQAFDTGAYLEGTCSLEANIDCHPCDFRTKCANDYICNDRISPQTVLELALSYLKNKTWHAKATDNTRMFIAKRDENGYLNLVNLQNTSSDRENWIELQRHYYRQLLDTLDSKKEANFSLQKKLKFSPNFLEKQILILEQASSLFQLLIEQSKLLKLAPNKYAQKFLATCHMISSIFEKNESFTVLGRFWQNYIHNNSHKFDELVEIVHIVQAMIISWHLSLTAEN